MEPTLAAELGGLAALAAILAAWLATWHAVAGRLARRQALRDERRTIDAWERRQAALGRYRRQLDDEADR